MTNDLQAHAESSGVPSANVPSGPLAEKWTRRRSELGLVGPTTRRRHTVIVVGTGLAGASAAASLSELGYRVCSVCLQDSPRRAHSVAAQGGINAAKNYQNDGDSVERLFLDTLKGGDFRSREANVYRLAELSGRIIDQCVAQGIPFAREYGGQLANRSFGGALVSRTFYARGQTGQQLLLGAYQALAKEAASGNVRVLPKRELLDVIVLDGRARGIVTRDLMTGQIDAILGDAVVLATGGYASVYYQSTNAMSSNATAIVRAYRRGALFANPCFVQFHPTCLPARGAPTAKLTLMSESLRNDGRVWVPRTSGDPRAPADISEAERDYFLERLYPRYGNLVPRDIASRAVKSVCDAGLGVQNERAVYLDLQDAKQRLGSAVLNERYGNLFDTYARLTGDDPLVVPLRIYPAAHYSMGGLWVDYDLMTTIPGLFAIGECNFSDHGANRLGASALMQGLADGYFIVPYSIAGYLAGARLPSVQAASSEVRAAIVEAKTSVEQLIRPRGKHTVSELHRELGQSLADACGLLRTREELERATLALRSLRSSLDEVIVPGSGDEFNRELERKGRLADFLELGELMCIDALAREESCGCHFRQEYQRADGEALRNDLDFAHVAVFRHRGSGCAPERLLEPLSFDALAPTERSYR